MKKISLRNHTKELHKEVYAELQPVNPVVIIMLFSKLGIIQAYNLETILSEKLETIISRGDQNTRPRDFYDVYILSKLKWRDIDFKILDEALIMTSRRRKSENIIIDYLKVIDIIRESEQMKNHWLRYQKDFEYVNDIFFDKSIAMIT